MAKILYGVQSDGMGHALRSRPIIEHLISKGHTMKIVSSNKPMLFLQKHFKDVEEIERVSYFYYNNKVSYIATAFQFVLNLKNIITKGFGKIKKIVKEYQPDIIITDFEIFSAKSAKANKIPLISIDNVSMVSLTKTPVKFGNYFQNFMNKFTISLFNGNADHFFVTTFFSCPLRNPKMETQVTFVPAILREEIINTTPSVKNHVLVYQTTQTNKDLVPALLGCKNESFIYYGYNEDKVIENITFKRFSEKDFIEDFASCKALITNGGFTMISEAIYMKKPILSNPIGAQYEQYVNAVMLERMGFGKKIDKMTTEGVLEFLTFIPTYRVNLKKQHHDKNKSLFSNLDKEIDILLR